jgi:hypothetical protein
MIDRGEGGRDRARGGGGWTPEARRAAAEGRGEVAELRLEREVPEEARSDGPLPPSPCER